ncbi:MAG: hypothetical protein ACO2PN_15965 [Pyrobaculum sp.]|jgi:hypothetical protein
MTEAQTNSQLKKEYVAVFIKPETRKMLAMAKVANGFKSYDDLILHLLRQAGYADQ